jgi:hypothetical protein
VAKKLRHWLALLAKPDHARKGWPVRLQRHYRNGFVIGWILTWLDWLKRDDDAEGSSRGEATVTAVRVKRLQISRDRTLPDSRRYRRGYD